MTGGGNVASAAWTTVKSPYTIGNAAGTLMFDANAREDAAAKVKLAYEISKRMQSDSAFRGMVAQEVGEETVAYFSDPEKLSEFLTGAGVGLLGGAAGAAAKGVQVEGALQKIAALLERVKVNPKLLNASVAPFERAAPGGYVPQTTPKLIEKARRAGVRSAWDEELELINETGRGSRNWTVAQIRELKSTKKISGFEGHHINSVDSLPNLADDPNNIQFLSRKLHFNAHGNNWRNPTSGNWDDMIFRNILNGRE